jgi:hypothetical protein
MLARARTLITLTALVALLWSAGAAAQTNAEKAAAQTKFEEAKRLMDKHKYREACALFEESLRLDNAMAARFRLAECYEKAGMLASAWINYVDVADAAQATRMRDRERLARRRAEALKPRLVMLTIKVPPAIAGLPGLEIRRGDVVIGAELWNAPAPVDPGEHRVSASAAGKRPWSGAVTAEREGAAVELSIGPLADEAPSEASAPAPGAPGAPDAPDAPAPAPFGAQRILALSVGGLGVAAMIAGVVVGVAARGHYDGSEAHCVDDRCDPEGLRIRAEARDRGTAATIVFVAGAVAGAAGGVLWLTAPSADGGGDVAIGVGPGRIALRGAF